MRRLTRLAAGDQAVHDLDAVVGERGDRARHAEVDVVGMGHHHEHLGGNEVVDGMDVISERHGPSLPSYAANPTP